MRQLMEEVKDINENVDNIDLWIETFEKKRKSYLYSVRWKIPFEIINICSIHPKYINLFLT